MNTTDQAVKNTHQIKSQLVTQDNKTNMMHNDFMKTSLGMLSPRKSHSWVLICESWLSTM